jgi:non-ribosomal peptide synthetase component F
VQNAPQEELKLEGLRLSGLGGETEAGRFELTVWASEGADGRLSVRWNYDPQLHRRERIERMHGHFAQLLGAAVAEPEAQLNALEMFSEAEKQEQLLKEKALAADNYKKFKNIKPKAYGATAVKQAMAA